MTADIGMALLWIAGIGLGVNITAWGVALLVGWAWPAGALALVCVGLLVVGGLLFLLGLN